jgi:molecular chaperone DnaK (HSP70)
MTRATVDWGIHLGMARSQIAVLTGSTAEVIRNTQGDESTSSVVYMGRKGELITGAEGGQREARVPSRNEPRGCPG